MTFMAIDVGNTRLKWTLYDRPAAGARMLAQGAEFLEQIDRLGEVVWSQIPEPTTMLGCIVAATAVKTQNQALCNSMAMPGEIHSRNQMPAMAEKKLARTIMAMARNFCNPHNQARRSPSKTSISRASCATRSAARCPSNWATRPIRWT